MSDRRIPDDRNFAIAGTVFLNVCERGKRVVEPLDPQFFHPQHVIDLTTGSLRLRAVLIVEGMPIGMAHEQKRYMRHVGLYVHTVPARRDDK